MSGRVIKDRLVFFILVLNVARLMKMVILTLLFVGTVGLKRDCWALRLAF